MEKNKGMYEITQEQAEAILQFRLMGLDPLPDYYLMCQGWLEDHDFQELTTDYLQGVVDNEFENFQLFRKENC